MEKNVELNNCIILLTVFFSCTGCDVLSLHSQIHIKHGSNFKWKSRCKVERDGQKWTDSEVSNSLLIVRVYHVIYYKHFVIKLPGIISRLLIQLHFKIKMSDRNF